MPKATPINVFDLQGNFVGEFESKSKFARDNGIMQSEICACIKGTRTQAGGFIFEPVI